MGVRRTLLAFAVLVPLAAVGSAQQKVPEALAGWRDWVLDGNEHVRCPFWMSGGFGAPDNHVCAWPQELRLEVGSDGARFSAGWTAFARTWLSLPGDRERWPFAVRLDGVAAPVVERGGAPAVLVPAGRHRIEGALAWERRPEAVRVPEEIGRVTLLLDGREVFPLQREGPLLWLGRAEAAASQADALAVQVYRRLSDALPFRLETRVRLNVSGQGREVVLGPVLPAGTVTTDVTATLPVLLAADGMLAVKLRPGNWEITIGARGLSPLDRLGPPAAPAPWPSEEIWSFEPSSALRVTTADGGRTVDPGEVDVPGEWRALPAFVLERGSELTIEERSRGMAGTDANRLALRREIWLDFEGDGLTVRDDVSGRMLSGFRLDVASPFVLARVDADGSPLLVTRGAEEGLTGVELRDPDVRLTASSRVDSHPLSLPVTGWRTGFESVAATLHLPPGRELIAALGADSSPQAWLDRWSLFDLFMLLLTTIAAFRLLGRAGGVLTLAFLVLSYHESVAPLWALLSVFALGVLHRALPPGRGATAVATLRLIAVGVLAIAVLPFVARELRLALYPQLEAAGVGAYATGVGGIAQVSDAVEGELIPAAPPQEIGQAQEQVAKQARGRLPMRYQRFAASNVFQAGGGEPGWAWRRAALTWSGPVRPEQRVALLVLPAWATRLLRVVMVGLLAALLLRLARALRGERREERAEPAAAAAAVAALAMLAFVPPVLAQQTPDPALLAELKSRLLRVPDCVPSCGRIESATVVAEDSELAVILTVHAAERVAVPVPAAENAWRITDVSVDGGVSGELLRHDGLWVPLERGVHRVEARGALAPADLVELRFPAPPARVIVRGDRWEASGVRDGRLLTDTLGLVRLRREERSASAGAAARVAPFVHVERTLDLDLDWTMTTRVSRVAPRDGSLTAEVPLVVGESLLTPGIEVRGSHATAALGPGVAEVSWSSRLAPADRLELSFASLVERSETWRITVSPQWSARFTGVPATLPGAVDAYWVHEFHPLPGETLEVAVARPEAIAGPTAAIDRATLTTRAGRRASEHTLSLTVRSTRGGQHELGLPDGAEVLEVSLDGAAINVRPNGGRLAVPIHPGRQQVVVRWRDAEGIGLRLSTPAVDLGAAASNLDLEVTVPDRRWVLLTSGPDVGPAVLYWGEILVMALLAFALARVARTPLKLRHWLLLGLGFSTFSWLALAVVVGWLLALAARERLAANLDWWRFDLMQLALVGLSIGALACLVAAVPFGLLGSPDMHIAGIGSSGHHLRWFADRSPGPLPTAAVLSLPIFFYRVAMLAWALWLVLALVGWLRWAWRALSTGGGWRRPPAARAPVAQGS